MEETNKRFVETFVGAVTASLEKAPAGALGLDAADQAALAEGLRKVDGAERDLAMAALVKMIEQLHSAKQQSAASQLMALLQVLKR